LVERQPSKLDVAGSSPVARFDRRGDSRRSAYASMMVALPLFWDQYDNAQRVHETGFGVRLPTYEFEEGELLGALDRLVADDHLGARMRRIAARVQAAPGTEKAAGLIERIAAGGQ
jgi:UDP:flavonoid glycosyltransferase YjiC (YdhE family)